MRKGVEIRVRADATQAKRELQSLEKGVAGIEKTANRVSKAFRNLAIGITGTFAATGATGSIVRATDSLTNLENQVALVTGRGKELQGTLKDLYGIAARSRMPVSSTATTYNRFGLALEGTGKSAAQLLIATEAVSQAAVISGATAESANAAIIQLGQGLASGELRGEELNSVLEQTPRLARAIAAGMGVPFGELRALAKDGQLDAETVFAAIIDQADALNEEFKTIEATTSGLTSVMKDELTRALGAIDNELGFSDALRERIISATGALRGFADNLGIVVGQAKGKLRLFLNDLAFFRYEVKQVLLDMFTEGFDASTLTDPLVNGLKGAYSAIEGIFEKSIQPKIEAIDLDSVITNLTSALDTLSVFAGSVIAIFKHIWKRIVGESLWTGIFDPGHEEGGATAIGNTGALSKYLNAATKTIKDWAADVVAAFNALHTKATAEWDRFKNYLSSNDLTVSTISFDSVSNAWSDAVDTMSTKWQEFRDSTTLDESAINKFDSVGGNRAVTAIKSGANEIFIRVDSASEAVINTLSSTLEALGQTPAVVTGRIVITSLIETAKGENEALNTFITGLDENKEKIGVLIAAALATGVKIGFGKLLIGGFVLLNVKEILASEAFQASVFDFAEGVGGLIADAFSGSDPGAELLDGAVATFSSIGAGLAKGLFGKEFETEAFNKLTGALAVAAGLAAVSAKAREAFKYLGLKLAAWIAGTQFAAALGAEISAAMATSTLVASVRASGVTLGTVIQGGLVLGITVGLAVLVRNLIDSALQGVYNVADRTFRGETAEEQAQRRSQRILDLVNQGADGVRRAALIIESGKATSEELATLGAENLSKIKDAIETTEDSYYDAAKAVLGLKTSLQFAAGEIDQAMRRVNNSKLNEDPTAVIKKASGGYISGSGGPTDDLIPAMLSNGEYVIKASSVSKFGKGFLDQLNGGMLPQFFSGGGMVTPYDDEIAALESDVRKFERLNDPGLTSSIIASNLLLEDLKSRRRKFISTQSEVSLDGGVGDALSDTLGGGSGKVGKEGEKSDAVKSAEGFALSFKEDFANSLGDALKTGDVKGFFTSILDSFSGKVIDSFAQGLTDKLFDGLIGEDGEGIFADIFGGMADFGGNLGTNIQDGLGEGLSKLGQGAGGGGGFLSGIMGLFSGGGGFLSGLFSGIGSIFGFSSGGIVPNTPLSSTGRDSVPALLTPGELVVPERNIDDFMNSGSGSKGSTVVNLSITGDISRQTKQEIVRMLPEISAGVNRTNKENNYRGR